MATVKELEAMVAQLAAQNAILVDAAKPTPRTMHVKVSPVTGCIVVSGLTGKNPMSFYQNTWKALLTAENAGKILNFIDNNQPDIDKFMAAAGKVNR